MIKTNWTNSSVTVSVQSQRQNYSDVRPQISFWSVWSNSDDRKEEGMKIETDVACPTKY